MYTLYILTVSFLISISPAQTGADRCEVRDCLCVVTPGTSTGLRTVTSPEKRRFAIYFEEDSHEIPAQQSLALKRFTSQFGEKNFITISLIGYTDGCGSSEHNSSLSRRRAAAASSVIKNIIPNAKISQAGSGENSPNHLPEARRVDVVVHTESKLTTAIERIPADVYLIDASGSMWNGWRDWQEVVNASLKPGSKVYLSIMTGCRNGQRLSSVTPQSGTEIWYSYWKVLDHMKRGQTLAIISDFQSNVPLTQRESAIIRRKAESIGVEVITIR